MRIAYLGNFSVDFSTETHISMTLKEMGHAVAELQENENTAGRVTQYLQDAGPWDLFMWTRTGDWLKGDARAMLNRAKDLGIPTVAFHLDLYAPLARNNDPENHPWWRMDYVFTPDGGSDAFWERLGINHVFSPPGVYGPECYIANVPIQRDVLFVGQYHYHDEWPYRPQLIDWLKATYGERFHHYGHSVNTTVRGHALNHLYASTKVVVGDSLCVKGRGSRYWSDRLPETLGRGGFIIFPEIDGIRDYFSEDELATYTFGDFDELRRKIDYYLEHDDEREAIRRAGHEAVLRHSTYTHRMESMLNTVFQGDPSISLELDGRYLANKIISHLPGQLQRIGND